MRKLITLLLSGVMLVTSIPGGVAAGKTAAEADLLAIAAGETAPEADTMAIAAGEKYPSSTATKDTNDKALEKAIKAVKAKITIPKEYSQFDYYFSEASSYAGSFWSLSWRNPVDYSYIQVNCDLAYHITYYTKYDNSTKKSSLPTYLKNELKEKADKFIKEIAPEVASKLQFLSSDYEGIYSGNYTYTYQRIENGILFPDNSVVVMVDSVSGEVKGISISWLYDAKIPSADATVTKKEAAELLRTKLKMSLRYRMNYYRIYYDSIMNNKVKDAFLIYEPDQSYIAVDAKTGELYLTRSEWRQKEYGNGSAKSAEAAADTALAKADGGSIALTEEEIAKIKELEGLISKEKAIELVTGNKSLYIDKNLMSYNAYLNKSSGYSNTTGSDYVWNIDLRDARPVDYNKDTDWYRAYANATVDAKTGKILSFNANVKSNYDEKTGKWNTVKISYTKEKSQKILDSFLQDQINNHFKKTKLVNTREDYVAYYKEGNVPVYGGYYFQYNRFNDGVEFDYDGIYGAVDGVTGKIYSYRYNWTDKVVFESPEKAMSADQAMDAYLAKEGFQLVYEINEVNTYDPNYKGEKKYYDDSEAYSVAYEVRLVYRPDINPPYISPFTGEQLNYDGTVYKKVQPFVYEDIENKPENREILLLADMKIGFEGNKFYPDQNITVSEFNTLLSQVGYGYNTGDSSSTDNRSITREQIAFNFIDKLGLKKMARLKGIYATGYVDESNINPNYLGAVALAKGYGIMEAEAGNNFNPKDNVTRAEAVHLIMSFISVQREGIY